MPALDLLVSADSDDTDVYNDTTQWLWDAGENYVQAGYGAAGFYKWGSGLRFANVTIPKGATIITAYLKITALISLSNTIVNSKITGDKEVDAATFTGLADYQARRGTDVGGADNTKRTVAQVPWDNIPAWMWEEEYQSPEIKTIIQEIVNQAGWVSNNHLALFWDDHEGLSTEADDTYRKGYSYLGSDTKCALLHIEYIEDSQAIPLGVMMG